MAVIKVRDLAYGRLRSPDLDMEEEFLTAFGMVRAARTPTALYMRGTDPVHHIHVTEKGDPGFIGFAWAVSNEDELKADLEVAWRVGHREHRRTRWRQAGPTGRAKRLHNRDRPRHRNRAADPCRASADQLWCRAAEPRRRGHPLCRRAVQCEADRPCSPWLSEKSGDRSLVPRDAGSGLVRTMFMPGKRRTLSANSAGSMPAMNMSTTTPSSA